MLPPKGVPLPHTLRPVLPWHDWLFPEVEHAPLCSDTSTSWLRCSVMTRWMLMWTVLLLTPPYNLLQTMIRTWVGSNMIKHGCDCADTMSVQSWFNKINLFLLLAEQPSSSQLLDLSRKTPWSDQETRTLLEIWGEDNVQLTLRGCLKNRHVFDYISEKMGDGGYIRSSEQCYTRIKRLKYGFLHEKWVFTKPFFSSKAMLICYWCCH